MLWVGQWGDTHTITVITEHIYTVAPPRGRHLIIALHCKAGRGAPQLNGEQLKLSMSVAAFGQGFFMLSLPGGQSAILNESTKQWLSVTGLLIPTSARCLLSNTVQCRSRRQYLRRRLGGAIAPHCGLSPPYISLVSREIAGTSAGSESCSQPQSGQSAASS